jgi:hypothetical protein
MQVSRFLQDTKGATAVVTAIFLVVAVGSMSVAIDLGHLFLVKCELQAAADAGAMAGARGLLGIPAGATSPVAINPDCSRALTHSQNIVAANKSDGALLTLPAGDVAFGWYDSGAKTFVFGGCSDPKKVTAVKVVARKDSSANSSMPLFFGEFLGKKEIGVKAEAVALSDYAGYAPPGVGTFPLAVDRDKVPPHNLPFKVHLNPTPGDEGCWHAYKNPSSGASDTRAYIDGTLPSPEIRVGDQINVKEGVSDSVLQEVDRQLAARTRQGKTYDILVPVIPANSSHANWQPVEGFASMRITRVEAQGAKKYVEGQILPNMVAPGVEPGGPDLGTRAGVPKMGG